MKQRACDNCGTLFADRSGKCPSCGAIRDNREFSRVDHHTSSEDPPQERIKIQEKKSSQESISSSYITGFVLTFSVQDNQGLISGDDGNRYYFYGYSWNSSEHPTEGMRVEFNLRENEALSIYKDLRSETRSHANSGDDNGLRAKQTVQSSVPTNLNRFNWGALFLTLPWSVVNEVWIGVLCVIPYVGFIIAIYLGFKGNELAWKAKPWRSFEHFKRHQEAWDKAGFIALGIFFIIGFLIGLSGY